MEQANVSQCGSSLCLRQLLLLNRKSGNQVIYAVRDPTIIDVKRITVPITMSPHGALHAGRD